MPEIVITGGAGFIGSNLTIRLVNAGNRVIVVDNLSFGSLSNLDSVINDPDLKFIKADICRPGVLENACREADVIVHLAAYKIPRYGNALKTLNINNDGTKFVLEQAAKYRLKAVIASTSDVYGKNAGPPFKETDDLVLGPPHIRRWAYAVSKAFDEQLALAFYNERELPVVLLRFFGSYGPHNHRSWWGGPQAVFIEQALKNEPLTVHGDGRQTRSFCYVSDTVEGIVKAIESREAVGKIINVGSDEEIDINSLAQKIIKLTGSKSEIEYVPYKRLGGDYEDVRRRFPDLTRARQILDFEPKVPLNEGLGITIQWQKKMMLAKAESHEYWEE
jgi:UDP-glucose 4-epimerase